MISKQFPDQRSTHERPNEPVSPLKIRSRRGGSAGRAVNTVNTGKAGSENGPDAAPKGRKRTRAKGRRSVGSVGSVGAAGFGRLASPRDRQRATERNAEERVRVEKMLASTPLPTDRRGKGRVEAVPNGSLSVVSRTSVARSQTGSSFVSESAAEAQAAWNVPRPSFPSTHSTGCPVCASSKVTTDEVFQRGATPTGGMLRLSECLICDHRWTKKPRRRFAEAGARMSRASRNRPQAAASFTASLPSSVAFQGEADSRE